MAEDNLRIWKQVCHTDPNSQRLVKYGSRQFTAVNAQKQLKRATELWGPYGSRWGLRLFKWGITQIGEIHNLALEAEFFYPSGAFPICVDMRFKPDDECRKKLVTDARSKALSCLGFNSDIFEGRWEDNRYVQEMEQLFGDREQLRQDILVAVRSATTEDELDKFKDRLEQRFADDTIDKPLYQEAVGAIAEHLKTLTEENHAKAEDGS